DGQQVKLVYEPQLPFGARLLEAVVNGRKTDVEIRHFPEEDQAHLEIKIPTGSSHCRVSFAGGVSIMLKQLRPQLGEVGSGMKIRSIKWSSNVLSVDADVSSAAETTFQLNTPLRIADVKGATINSVSAEVYELTIRPHLSPESFPAYQSSEIEIVFTSR